MYFLAGNSKGIPQRGIWKFLDKSWHVQAIPGVSVVGLVKNTEMCRVVWGIVTVIVIIICIKTTTTKHCCMSVVALCLKFQVHNFFRFFYFLDRGG